jgi:hypothetical protein
MRQRVLLRAALGIDAGKNDILSNATGNLAVIDVEGARSAIFLEGEPWSRSA